MQLGEVVTRVFETTGDNPANPRLYDRQRIVDLVNRAMLIFRSEVEDRWARTDMALVAGQAIYSLPEDCVRVKRIAYNDQTLEAKTILGLVALDPKWEVTPSQKPLCWTQDGLPFNQFRLWPVPSANSATSFAFAPAAAGGGPTGEDGVIVEFVDDAGAQNVTYVIDPADPAMADADRGLTISLDIASMDSDDGELAQLLGTSSMGLTLWYVVRPQPLVGDGDGITIKEAYADCLWFYALWQSYEEQSDHHNPVLSSWYKTQFRKTLARARERSDAPLPRTVHQLGLTGKTPSRRGILSYPYEVVVNGQSIQITFSRRAQ